MIQIQKTTDYSRFKFLQGNRPIEKYHLNKLKKSIESDNQLQLHPIIVNKDNFIIDGQHRLMAAKQLDLEIFYIQSEYVPDLHLIECNVNQKSWETENYIDYFATKEKLEPYIELKSMIKSSGLKPKALLTLILGTVSHNILDFLKTGKFRFPSQENPQNILLFYSDFCIYVKDKRLSPFSMFTNHNFTRSLRWLKKTSNFDSDVFFKKLDLRWFDLKPQRTSEDWYQLLLNIYNFKNHNRLENEYVSDR